MTENVVTNGIGIEQREKGVWGHFTPGTNRLVVCYRGHQHKYDLRQMNDYAQAHWVDMINRDDTWKKVEFERDFGVTIYFELPAPRKGKQAQAAGMIAGGTIPMKGVQYAG